MVTISFLIENDDVSGDRAILPPSHIGFARDASLKTEASSYAEVVKNALRIHEASIEETESGKQFLVRDCDGVVSSLRLFL